VPLAEGRDGPRSETRSLYSQALRVAEDEREAEILSVTSSAIGPIGAGAKSITKETGTATSIEKADGDPRASHALHRRPMVGSCLARSSLM